MLVLKNPYSLRRATGPSLISGIKPSRFGGSIGNSRTGANEAITGGAGFGCEPARSLDAGAIDFSIVTAVTGALVSDGATVVYQPGLVQAEKPQTRPQGLRQDVALNSW